MRPTTLVSRAFAALAIFSVGISTAQQPKPRFEAAVIKPANPKQLESSTSGGPPGGLYRMSNMSLRQWVKIALSLNDYALKAPSWLDTSKFDLEARLPNQPADKKALAEMLRALLIERFGLKWHEETQTVSGYELVTDKKVLATPASLLERIRSASSPTLLQGTNMPMSEVAERLGDILGHPIVDKTNLSGGYDFKLSWRPSDEAEIERQRQYGVDVDNLPGSVFTAIREQLGLRLQSAKVPTKVVVVDAINHQPTPN